MADSNFVEFDKIQVIIPYSTLEKMVYLSQEVDEMKSLFQRTEEQYAAIRGMFSECLQKIREIENFVKD